MAKERPGSLDLLWTEKDLCQKLGLKMGKDHSIVLGHWIGAGLQCTEISGRRFFWESDVIDYMVERQARDDKE